MIKNRGEYKQFPMASILVPAYNGEKYLRKALDSAINQTYKDFEIVLIDDGSTDSTPEICDEYGEKYPFIHVYHQANMGPLYTREKLVENANGKFIFWLDQDDYWDYTLLEKSVNAFEEHNADIVTWGRVSLTTNGMIFRNDVAELGIEKWRQLVKLGFHGGLYNYASKLGLWRSYESSYDNVDLLEDIWMSAQIVSQAKKIITLGDFLYFYNCANMESFSKTYTSKKLCRDGLSFYRILKRALRDNLSIETLNSHHIKAIRKLLTDAYCVDQVNPYLNKDQKQLIKGALKDLDRLFAQRKMSKFYIIQQCVINGFNFICRHYGRGRIKKFRRNNEMVSVEWIDN